MDSIMIAPGFSEEERARVRSLVLDEIWFDSAARGRGLGTALLSAADDHARRTGVLARLSGFNWCTTMERAVDQ